MTLERIPEIPRPVGITDVKGVVNYLGNLATTLQDHMSMRPEDLQNLVDGFVYSSTTHATTHSNGGTDAVNHDNLAGFVANEHLLTAAIDHDSLLNFVANKHLLPAAIDHDALLNFVANEHLLPAAIDHGGIGGLADNDHPQYFMPVGVIMAWLGGYFADGSNGTYTRVLGATNDVAGANGYVNPYWHVCNGAALNDADSPIFNAAGRYLPNLTDDRFIMGATVAGGIGGSSTMAHTHTVDPASVTSGAGSSHSHGSNAKTSGAGSAHGHGITGAITAEAAHTHAVSGTSGNQSANHVHGMAGHTHGLTSIYHRHGGVTTGAGDTSYVNGADSPTAGPSTANTDGVSADHTHTLSFTSGVGASHTHAHTLAIGNESAHTHGYNQSDSAEAAHTHAVDVAIATSSAASNAENRPLFLGCFYIMKVK